jgi:uroporphyrinogen decarboxylase
MVCLPPALAPAPDIFAEGDYNAFVDRWGSKLHMPQERGLYFDWVDFPIQESTMTALDNYNWPCPDPPEYNAHLRRQAQYLFENSDYALVGTAIFGGGIFEQALRLRGMEDFLMALLTEPAFADQLMERVTDIYVESCNNYLDALGEYLHVFLYFDDVCGQDGWLISPEIYRERIKPKQRQLVEAVKKKTKAKLFYHGCGATYPLIPELIEIGFDIINPVQVSARDMDTRRLKRDFGKDMIFWGGGVDTQHVLPFGKPEEVAHEVRRRIDDLAPEGGFVFAAVHNIQSLVPPQNTVTAFETALEYGRYR